jgi:hypothetical protein
MPKFLEKKLKKKYGNKSAVPYKIMNSIGAMYGNKETEKGEQMEKKHEMGLGGKKKSLGSLKKKKKSFSEALNS